MPPRPLFVALLTGVFLAAAERARAQSLAEALDLHGAWTMDVFRGMGVDTATVHLHNVDLTAALDGNALGWSGGRVFVYVLANAGESLSEVLGDLQGANNIEAPRALRLYEAWVEQEWAGGRFSVLAGLFDLNSEFFVMERGDLFLHSSHGIGTSFSQTGTAGPSIFPVTSLALRASVTVRDDLVLRTAVLDAVPGDPERPGATVVDLSREEGALVVGEGEWGGEGWRAALGGWSYTRPTRPAWAPGNARPERSRGVYGVLEGDLASWRGGAGGVGAFGRLGLADPDVDRVDLAWGGGVVARGVWARRPDDRLGLAVGVAHNGASFLEAQAPADPRRGSSEVAVEAAWELAVTPWLAVSLDAQGIRRPDTVVGAPTAVALGARVILSF